MHLIWRLILYRIILYPNICCTLFGTNNISVNVFSTRQQVTVHYSQHSNNSLNLSYDVMSQSH